MGMGIRRRSADDEVTGSLLDRGVFRLSRRSEAEAPRKERSPFGFWAAVKYGTVLTFLLWWLPIIGQVAAGYVCGRKAGDPMKGALAAALPLAVLFAICAMVTQGWIPTSIGGISLVPQDYLRSWSESVPVLASYMDFSRLYLDYFLGGVQMGSGLRLDLFIITIAFAYIGGIMADQSRKEMNMVAARPSAPRSRSSFVPATKAKRKGPGPVLKPVPKRSHVSFDDLQERSAEPEDLVERGVAHAEKEVPHTDPHVHIKSHSKKKNDDMKANDWRFI
jgi:hypothetical protein